MYNPIRNLLANVRPGRNHQKRSSANDLFELIAFISFFPIAYVSLFLVPYSAANLYISDCISRRAFGLATFLNLGCNALMCVMALAYMVTEVTTIESLTLSLVSGVLALSCTYALLTEKSMLRSD